MLMQGKCLPWNAELFLLDCQPLQQPTAAQLSCETVLVAAWLQFQSSELATKHQYTYKYLKSILYTVF
jgi:hypothetical protein